ncbi:Potassium channel AKT2 [Hondaea fermentalgiana]|uniref:Potassium channel AKT2 n=1 Tax=Hondaea fermentalgiana TaxID=2315210 RepID=A0A2R5G6T0_9STRA|nr:Potassium channel AKT2 [Hondaea fermentalgiana]|eukprot:GBG26762.1 Potassium channel AKT2 [Hondaea fermentalgiana]
MTALLKNLNVTTTHFKHHMEMITRYLRARQITPEVRLKVAIYFEFLWDRQRGRLESQILNPLPADLRDKISQGRRSALLNIPVFQNRDMAFLDAIATSLEPQIISPGDFLCLRNTPVDAMWILGEGLLEVLTAGRGDGVSSRHGAMRSQQSRKHSGFRLPWSKGQGQPEHKAANRGESHSSAQAKVVETIRPGVKGFYGEEILFSTRFRHKFSVRAAQVCEVQCLDIETFLFVLEIFGAHRHEDLFDDQSQVSTPVSGHEAEVSEVASSIGSRMSLLSGLTKPKTKGKDAGAGTGGGEPDGKDKIQMSLQQARFGRGERRNRSSMVSAEVIQDIIAPPILRDRSGGNLILPPIPHHVDLAGPSEAGKVEVLVQDSNVIRTVREWKERDAKRLENAKKKAVPKRAFTLRSLSMAASSVDRCQALFSVIRFLAGILSASWSAVRRNYWSQISWNAAVIVAHLALCILPPLDLVLLARGSSNALPWHVYAMSDVIVFVNVVCVPHFQAKSSAGGSSAGVANKEHAGGNESTLVKSSSTNQRTSGLKFAQGTLAHRGRGQLLLYGTLGVIALCAYGVRASRELFMHIWAPLRLTSIVLFWPLLFEEIQRFGHRFEWFRRRSALQIVALNVAFAIAVTVHWSSCIASCLSSRGDWVIPEAHLLLYDSPDLRENELTYWHAFYWTVITMTTVGYGDITPRDDLSRLASLIVMISGVLLYAGFISIVAAITRNASGVDHELEQFEDCCKHYLAQREVPRKLTSDCCLYLEYLGAHQQRLQELTMLANGFPQSLEDCIREDILSKTFFGSGSIFADAPQSFVRCLQRRMHKDVFLPEHIITCGFDPASGRKRNDPENRGITDAMIFLEEGQANIVGFVEDGEVQKNMGLLGSGRAFAAVALFDPSLQHHMLRAKTTCEVWFLSRRELELCVKEHESGAHDLAGAAHGASGASTPNTAASQDLDPETPTSSRSSRDDLRHFVYETVRERAEKATHNAENVAKNLGNAKLNKFMMSTRNVTETTSDWGVCLPEAREQAMWSLVMAIVTAYNILTASYRIGIGFGAVGDQLVTMSVLDAVADICLLCNVVLRDRIFAIEVDGGSEVSWATSSEEVALLTIHNLTGTESVEPTDDTYIRSVYWAVATLTTVGYGDYAPVKDSEIAYTLLLLLCGGFLYALILNNLEEIIAQSDNCSILFQRKVDAMATYMKRRTLPSSVVHQVTSYYKTLWIRQKGVEESWIQDRLPLTIRRSIRADLIGPRALQAFPLFAQWDETEKLLDLLRPSMVMEDAIIFMEGQLILKCYFVGRGQVEYVSGDAKQVCTSFSSGDSFGEIQFFFNEPTECIARAKERTDLLVLHRLDFDNFVQERPSLATRFSQDLSAIEGDLRKRASLEAFTRNLGRSKVNKLFRVDTDSATKPRWLLWNGEKLLPPHNIYRRLWDLLVFTVVLYNIVGGTYRMAFLRESVIGSRAASDAMSFLGLDVLADFIIVLDAIFHATLFAAVTPTSILWDRSHVRANFFRRQLIMYIAILLPMDYALRLGAFRSRMAQNFGAAFLMNPPPHVIAMGRASRLLLLPRQPSLERSVQSLIEERGVVISSGNKQILRLAFRAIILVHLMACVKCALSSRFLELMGSEHRALDAYMLCLYWAVYTISTVGYGDIPVDAPTFAIVCIILGNFLCDAGLTATVSNILSNRETKLSDAKRHRTALVQYMKSHRIDAETRLEVLDFVDFRVSALGSLDEASLLDEANVPSYVRAQIAACIALQSAPHLGAHPMFKGFSLGLVQSMALMLSPVVLARGHKLISNDSSKPGMVYTSGKARRPSRPKNEDSEDGNGEGKASGKIPRGGLKYVSSRTYGLSPPAESGGGSSVAYRKMDEMPELASLDFLRQAKLTDPSKSLHLASHANVGWRRYPASADDDNLYFLVSGRVRVTSGLESKTIRRGLICRASGIDGAVALSHCEAFVLEVAQFRVLAQYSAHIGNGIFKDFIELLRDRDGYAAVEQFLTVRKNGDYISDIRFWRACETYEASPTRSAAVAIGREFVYGPECLLDFGPLARKIKETLAEGHSRDLFSQAKRDIYHRLELVVKPRFLASAEFADLLVKKANGKTSSRSQPTKDDGDQSAETIRSVPEGSAVTEGVATGVADNVQRARSSSALDVTLDDVDERKDEVVPPADDVEVGMNEAADDEEHANLDAATPSILLSNRFAQEEKDHLDPIVSPDSEPSDDEVDALQPVIPELDRFATEEDDLA